MSFAELSELYFSKPASVRNSATLEYRSSSGSLIMPGIRSADETTLVRADGRIEYRRRGDFGERGGFPPGAWHKKCEPGMVERLWDKIGDIHPDSFPSRVADPGDAIRYLVAYVPDRLARISIGPEDPENPFPGSGFFRELYPILGIPDPGECLWAVEMSVSGISPSHEGVSIQLKFQNPGKHPIALVLNGIPEVSDFTFRFARMGGASPYPKWSRKDSRPAEKDHIGMLLVAPGKESTCHAFFPNIFLERGRYKGAVAYHQLEYVDALAGQPILTGSAFTDMVEFEV